MTDRPHIVHAIGSLGLGGDAKNLCALARVQRAWARVSVMTLAREPGPRAGELERASIPCVTGMNEPGRLREWLRAQDRPIVYFHRNGAPDAHETEWLRVVHEARCPTFEYNTFGRADAQSDSLWVGHAHLSRAALLQYANRRGASLFAQEDHAAIGYAVDDVVVPNEVERDAAR